MDGVGGYAGWRWIFILEGIATVIVAIIAYFCLFDFPETASFLTEEERAFVIFRLKYQGQVTSQGQDGPQVAESDEFKWEYVWSAFKDWQIWVNIFVYWGVSPSWKGTYAWRLTNRDRLSALFTESAFSCPLSFETWVTVPARLS